MPICAKPSAASTSAIGGRPRYQARYPGVDDDAVDVGVEIEAETFTDESRPARRLVAAARWWRLAATRSSDTPCSMPWASTSRSGLAAKSPVTPKVMLPQ